MRHSEALVTRNRIRALFAQHVFSLEFCGYRPRLSHQCPWCPSRHGHYSSSRHAKKTCILFVVHAFVSLSQKQKKRTECRTERFSN